MLNGTSLLSRCDGRGGITLWVGSGLWLDRRVDRRGWVVRADLRSRPHLPSRAPLGCLGVGDELVVDRVADPSFEAASGFLGCFAVGDLAQVVAPAFAVESKLDDRGDVKGVVEPPVAVQVDAGPCVTG